MKILISKHLQNSNNFLKLSGTSTQTITSSFMEVTCGNGRILPSEMDLSVERLTLMLTTYGKLNFTGDNPATQTWDLSTPSMENSNNYYDSIAKLFNFQKKLTYKSIDFSMKMFYFSFNQIPIGNAIGPCRR